ncbi:MAG: redoxin domain-containing protein [Akkermansiaceae bacterium]|nr:redoxin domain-containing protein [Akkermansiaceae bacterium]
MRGVLSMLLAVTAVLPCAAEVQVFEVLGGERVAVFAKDGAKAAVLVFIDTECPIANAYHPELRRLEKKFGPQGVRFFMVHADPETSVQKAAKHKEDFGITAPVVIDKGQKWVKKTGATVTPEAVVVTPDGGSVYRGRIDDRYADFGKKRPEAKTRDLELALTAVLAGRPVPSPRTKAVGCRIFVE